VGWTNAVSDEKGLPSWLPDIVDLLDDSDKAIDELYDVFERDFTYGRPRYENRPVWWNRNEVSTPYGYLGYTFWHLISREDQNTGIRQFDIERAKRITWCAAIIKNAACSEVKVWERPDPSGNPKTYLWLQDFDYLVILQKLSRGDKGEVVFLVTGFYVDKHKKKQLSRWYRNANTAP
jgi:hypothetical protein